MKFFVLPKGASVPNSGRNAVYLKVDHWNDYSFVTMFHMSLHDQNSRFHEIGNIKIGFKGQTIQVDTYARLENEFEKVRDEFFALGQGVEFYRNVAALPDQLGQRILSALRDVVIQPEIIEDIREEEVFGVSLLRDTSLSSIKGQYARVLGGQPALTNFEFKFVRSESEDMGGIELRFDVKVDTAPSTNIHAVIGRNGVGKTTLLNDMIEAITNRQHERCAFINSDGWHENKIADDFFSSLVSVSFSAFDSFTPPKEQPDPAKGACYFYIGLKDPSDGERHRTIKDLQDGCIKSLISCFYDRKKTARWLNAIDKLSSDENFASMKLEQLETIYRVLRSSTDDEGQFDSTEFFARYKTKIISFLSRMSSGHWVVFLTITRLVATVEEKTLVLLDEPESHLHPPLLSAFVRALSDLLHDQNGVAIIATHSPVVLQELPSSCVWKLFRVRKNVSPSRPSIETFAENVGLLTSEVFSLEVERSGFHDLLTRSVAKGQSYEQIVSSYCNQLGFEGKAILKALIADRDRSSGSDKVK